MKYKGAMRRFSFLFMCFGVLLMLVGCSAATFAVTGSSEEGSQSNIVFAVAFQDQIALIDGKSLTNTTDAAIQQDSLFASQALPNASQAIAFDFSRRDSRREELFLLSRDANNTAYISVFDMTKANIANGDGALVSKRAVVEVGVGMARAENVLSPSNFCVTDIQSSQSGRYLALVSNQRSCDDGSFEKNAIDIIDLGEDLQAEPELVFHKDLNQAIGENSHIFIDQAAGVLFFLEGSQDQGTLEKLNIPNFEETTVLRNLDIEDIIDIQRFGQINDSDEEMIIARTTNYAVVTNYLDTATLASPIEYGETVKQIFPNASPFTPKGRFFALSDTELFIYDSPQLVNNVSTFVNAQDAFYEPLNDYVYLLLNGRIQRYNALGVFDVPNVSLDSFNVSALEDVHLFSWVREASVETTP